MNIFQCEEKAKEIGFDKAKFLAIFPCGPVNCKWLDAYMGLIILDKDGMRDGFVTTRQLDQEYPNLFCSEPYIDPE